MRSCAVVLLPILAAVAGCASRPVAVAEFAPPPVVATVAPPPVYRPTPINAGLTPAATMWHLRAGLNVAALACRGEAETVIVARYNALLAAHRAVLASAEASYAAQYGAGRASRDAYDDAMTRLYNFFSQAPARESFCAAAAAVLADSDGVDDAALAGFAAERLPQLDRAFAAMTPALPVPVPAVATGPAPLPAPALAVRAVAAPTTVATVARVGVAAPMPRPRLDLDPSVFRDDTAVAR